MHPLRLLAISLLLATANLATGGESATAGSATAMCLGCHDFGQASPVHPVLSGSHGISGDPQDMAGQRGCIDCHGISTDHARAPTRVAPTVSFGPRWTATTAAQDGQCLACHEAGIAAHWRDALHMVNNLSCVTCHDIHTEQDKVLFPEEQAQVCTTCHKAQKEGMHGLADMADFNPPCTTCHNPHDHETARATMLENGSEGCRSCHNLPRMARSPKISDKVKGYHESMAKPNITCIDCHDEVAHPAPTALTAMVPEPLSRRQVTLFYPGMADSAWLLENHPGSQPLRQGRNCQQCHRGDEADMGQEQAHGFEPAAREVDVSFSRDATGLLVTLRWQGPADDRSISLMWGDDSSEEFSHEGCFAACHNDMPGMSRDRGQQTGKYLGVSRSQRLQLGQLPRVKSQPELQQLLADGEFAELWQVTLGSGQVRTGVILTGLVWQSTNLMQINKSYKDGQWKVVLTLGVDDTLLGKPVSAQGRYTFGIALHGAANPGARHWVSLPMTLSLAGDETEFKVEQQ